MTSFFKIFAVCLIFSLSGCSFFKPGDEMVYQKTSFKALKGFETETDKTLYTLFSQNCAQVQKYYRSVKRKQVFDDVSKMSTIMQWQGFCQKLTHFKQAHSFKQFLKENLDVYEVISSQNSLFTGYYSPVFKGSLHKTDVYKYPLYALPNDLYVGYLGDFDPELKGKTIVAKIVKNKLKPL